MDQANSSLRLTGRWVIGLPAARLEETIQSLDLYAPALGSTPY